jgi:hypothetical protein
MGDMSFTSESKTPAEAAKKTSAKPKQSEKPVADKPAVFTKYAQVTTLHSKTAGTEEKTRRKKNDRTTKVVPQTQD